MSRIQFTPDLLPSDITGAEVLHQVDGQNQILFQPGPLFGNLILADEINRAPAKVQAALLEAMEERQITVAGASHPLPPLFIVIATQVGGELDAAHLRIQVPGQGLDRAGLGQTRQAFQQQVTVGQQAHQDLSDHLVLAEHGLGVAGLQYTVVAAPW